MDEQNDMEFWQDEEKREVQIFYEGENQKKLKKEHRLLKNVLLIISSVLNILLFIIVLHSVNFTGVSYAKAQKFNLIKEIITNLYYEDIDETTLLEGCIQGMTNSVNDVYTTYFSEEEMKAFTQSTSDKYEGLGVSLVLGRDGYITIVETFEDSPAYNAGIRSRDKITKINGKDVTNLRSLDEVMPLMSGKLGDKVKLEILKANTNEKIEYELEISEIELNQVSSEILDNNIGYIKIAMFNTDVSKQFKEHLEKLKEKNIKALLVDVRDNLGGDYNEVIEIADTMLPKDSLIVYTIDKTNTKESEYAKENGIDIPIGVLVNRESASASEVLAGALKDNNRAWLLGNKTFGKGVVQSILEFKDGTGLKLTTARYYTPSGECIHGKGIEPDYKIDLPEEYKNYLVSEIPKEDDTQLKEAVRIIKEEI